MLGETWRVPTGIGSPRSSQRSELLLGDFSPFKYMWGCSGTSIELGMRECGGGRRRGVGGGTGILGFRGSGGARISDREKDMK